MTVRRKAGVALATIVAALGAFVPAASAQTEWEVNAAVDPVQLCREVFVGGTYQIVCIEAGPNKQIGLGATVAPFVRVGCDGVLTCFGPSVSVGTTGFLANPNYPLPELRPGGTIYHAGGRAGTVYANGASVAVNTPEFCVGDPGQCPGGISIPLPTP